LAFVGTATPKLLVDIATGLQLEKFNLKRWVSEKAFQQNMDLSNWIQALNDDFYEKIFLIANCDWHNATTSVSELLSIINNILILRLDEALFSELTAGNPKRAYLKFSGPVQHLEHPDLKRFVASITAFIVASDYNMTILTQLLDKVYPVKREQNSYFPKPDQRAQLRADPKGQQLQDQLEKLLQIEKVKP
jgi:hypothetical protein